jgi:hypothetical protein
MDPTWPTSAAIGAESISPYLSEHLTEIFPVSPCVRPLLSRFFIPCTQISIRQQEIDPYYSVEASLGLELDGGEGWPGRGGALASASL